MQSPKTQTNPFEPWTLNWPRKRFGFGFIVVLAVCSWPPTNEDLKPAGWSVMEAVKHAYSNAASTTPQTRLRPTGIAKARENPGTRITRMRLAVRPMYPPTFLTTPPGTIQEPCPPSLGQGKKGSKAPAADVTETVCWFQLAVVPYWHLSL